MDLVTVSFDWKNLRTKPIMLKINSIEVILEEPLTLHGDAPSSSSTATVPGTVESDLNDETSTDTVETAGQDPQQAGDKKGGKVSSFFRRQFTFKGKKTVSSPEVAEHAAPKPAPSTSSLSSSSSTATPTKKKGRISKALSTTAVKVAGMSMVREIIDGIAFEIGLLRLSIRTRGPYATVERGAWTPPSLEIILSGISCAQTDSSFTELTNIKLSRKDNTEAQLKMFRRFDISAVSMYLKEGAQTMSLTDESLDTLIPLQTDLPVCAKMLLLRDAKTLNTTGVEINGLSSHVYLHYDMMCLMP